ncbi:hypothetical protein Hdeb2414_s0025g00663211 [Helianthus debilis subsp. tardiflorus]
MPITPTIREVFSHMSVDMRMSVTPRLIVFSMVVKLRGRPFLHFKFPPQQEMVA